MSASPRPLRLSAWIAIVAMLLAALVPTVSHMRSAQPGAQARWGDVCSVDARLTWASAQVSAPPATPLHDDDHAPGGVDCLYCVLQADHLLPPLAVPALPALRVLAWRVPVWAPAWPPQRLAWVIAHPRGPPVTA